MGSFYDTLAQIQATEAARSAMPVAAAPMSAPSPTVSRLAGASLDPQGVGMPQTPTDPLSIAQGLLGAAGGVSGGGVGAMIGGQYGQPFDGRQTGPLRTVNGVTGVGPAIQQLMAARRKTGDPIFANVDSDFRTYAEQAALYQKYLAGQGNLAAPPGHSMHESGKAFDINSAFLAQNPDVVRYLLNHGFDRDVGGEPWHFTWTGR